MRRQITSFSLILCGLCFIFGGLASLINAPVVSAKPHLAPSARPPVDRPQPEEPTRASQPDNDDDDDDSSVESSITGRVTGTIINATTGAPAPGVTVNIGGILVTSDANGNYDKWLPIGKYTVGLMLTSEQATDIQEPQAVDVRAGDTTVQHLYFRSTLAPTATVQPLQDPTTVLAAAPVDVLPNTGVVQSEGESAEPQVIRPQHLPRTSIPVDTSLVWLSVGVGLVVIGTLVGMTTKRTRVSLAVSSKSIDNNTLLATLLATVPSSPSVSNEALLKTLLGEDVRG